MVNMVAELKPKEILPGKMEGFMKKDLKNIKVHLVPSYEFIAHVKKRSR